MPHVFAYGTLLAPQLMLAVAGGEFQVAAAVARGYRRSQLADRDYPGIAANQTDEVRGAVYLDVDELSLRRLDFYEGPEYVRGALTVRLDDGRELPAEAYIIPPANYSLMTDIPWDEGEFLAMDLTALVARAHKFMEKFGAGE